MQKYIDFDGVVLDNWEITHARLLKLGIDLENEDLIIGYIMNSNWEELLRQAKEIKSSLLYLKQMDPSLYEAALDLGATPVYALFKIIIPQIASGIASGFAMAVTLSLDDYFVATYTKPATFDTISTYVVNATKGSQTDIKTALWALSTIIFLIVIVVEIAINLAPARKAVREEAGADE